MAITIKLGLLLAQVATVVAPALTGRTVDDALITKLINTFKNPEKVQMTSTSAQEQTVTKIEMNSNEGGTHWLAVVSLLDKNKQRSAVVLDYTDYGERMAPEFYGMLSPYTDAVAEDPHEKGKFLKGGKKEPLTLYRLLQCVNDAGITKVAGKCFVYAYRLIRFANGDCAGLECINGANPVGQMKQLVAADMKITDKAEFQAKLNASFLKNTYVKDRTIVLNEMSQLIVLCDFG